MVTTQSNEDLLNQIRQKHTQIDQYVAGALPRKRRLINIAIVGSTLAAALTAGPAVGGASFTAWLTLTLGLTSPSWQLLCGAAATCCVAATVATQVLKSGHVEENVARALSCRAELEALEIGLTNGLVDHQHAASEYLRCVEEWGFIEV
jgi:hypothetical protein